MSTRAAPHISPDPLIAVEVGCRWDLAQDFLTKMPAGNWVTYGFDPDNAECARLAALHASHASGKVVIVPKALAGEAGNRTLYLTREPACSSLLRPDPALTSTHPALACARTMATQEIAVTTLQIWAQEAGVTAIDYLKLDTQGTELEIMRGAGHLLSGMRCIDVEVEFNPIYQKQALFSDVDMFLRSKGFMLWKLSNLVHYSHGAASNAALREDAVYYDDNYRYAVTAHGGQLYWANARYIASDVVAPRLDGDPQTQRDGLLFNALGAPDVVALAAANRKPAA